MTAKELSDGLKQAGIDQFGPDQPAEVFPSIYFNPNVVVIQPDGSTTPRAPRYCSTNLGATSLLQLFSQDSPENGGYICVNIVLGSAMNFSGLGGGFNDSELVPYLIFDTVVSTAESKPLNAALLLDYFNHGIPPANALANAILEIKGAF